MKRIVCVVLSAAFGVLACSDGPTSLQRHTSPSGHNRPLGLFGAGEPEWIELTPTGVLPSPRAGHAAVLDKGSNRLITFGGRAGGVLVSETWVLTAANGTGGTPTWIQPNPAGSRPPARAGHVAAYDPATNRLIITLGTTENFRLNDAWVLTNANGTEPTTPTWIQLSAGSPAPIPRVNPSGAYDSNSNRLIIFGGEGPFGGPPPNVLGDAWVLENANGTGGAPKWIQLSPSGPAPSARANPVATYDQANNRLIVFAGSSTGGCVPLNEVWVLDNANGLGGAPAWSEVTPGGLQPPPRLTPNAGYRPQTNRLVIFGGAATISTGCEPPLADVWVLANANGLGGPLSWAELLPTGGPPPARLAYASNSYDDVANRLVVFGGNPTPSRFGLGVTGFLNDVWVLINADGNMTVQVDIKPGSDPNSINPRSRGRIPVAILSTSDFDAVVEVLTTSLTFGATGDEQSLAFCASDGEEVSGDEFPDLVCFFETQATGFERGHTEGIMNGTTTGGAPIEGRDFVRILG